MTHRKTMPITPRQSTSSALENQTDAYLTHTPMVANSSAPRTIHAACMSRRRLASTRASNAHLFAVPLVELLHAVFHRALVGAALVLAAGHERAAAGVHSLGDLVVLDAGLHVGGLLRLDELALEGDDFLGVEELDHVERLLRADRMQGRDG